MQLDRVTVALRPRSDWEAVDLGLRMAQRHAAPAMAVWFMASLPWIAVLTYAGIALEQPGWALLAFWWLKPIFERPVLHVFSRAVFGDTPPRSQWLGIAMQQPFTAGFLGAMSFRRFEMSRSFNLPVRQLERLTGAARRQRLQVLHLNTGATAFALSLLSMGLVLLATITLVLLVVSLTLQQVVVFDIFALDTYMNAISERLFEEGTLWEVVIMGLYWLCEGLIAPFYVGAGFSLYLNRRTHLEAWDVELAFRRMLARRAEPARAASLAMLALGGMLLMSPGEAWADEDPLEPAREERRSQIEQIVDSDEFGRTEKQMRWVPKSRDTVDEKDEPVTESDLGWLGRAVAVLSEIAIWIAMTFVAVVLYRARHRWLPFFQRGRKIAAPRANDSGGLLLSEDELPEDIPAQVMALWQSEHYRDALSLLYRGALTTLNNAHDLDIAASDTEGDAERTVRRNLDTGAAVYFGHIAAAWARLAYGHDTPDTAQVSQLCEQWASIEASASV